MNITVRKIANGYVISYPNPNPEPPKMPTNSHELMALMQRQMNGEDPRGVAEWYCPTKAAVEENVRRIVAEGFAADSLKKGGEQA